MIVLPRLNNIVMHKNAVPHCLDWVRGGVSWNHYLQALPPWVGGVIRPMRTGRAVHSSNQLPFIGLRKASERAGLSLDRIWTGWMRILSSGLEYLSAD